MTIAKKIARYFCWSFFTAEVLLGATAASASVLANWTFETSIPATAGPFAAEAGLNAATSFASGLHASGSVVYSNPVGNGSTESFSSNFWSAGDYYQFTTSTTGYQTITFGWDQTSSSTGPLSFKLEADFGSGFVDILNPYAVGTLTWSSASSQAGSVFAPQSLGVSADNLSLLTVRLTSLATPSNTAGANRVDNIVISGDDITSGTVPESPALLVWAVLCCTVLVGWRRSQAFN